MRAVRHFLACLALAATVLTLALEPVRAQSSDRSGAGSGDQQRDSATVYVWGNSLIHHLTNDDDTAMPHWLSRLARAGGKSLSLDGQWGFVRDFADNLPPVPNWSFKEVRSGWSPERTSFANSAIDTILLNPANFIQYQPPSAPYDGPNPDGASPVSATVEVFRWVLSQGKSPTFHIYEGWAEMGRFPPTRRAYRSYVAHAQEEYHDWFRTYVDDVRAALPEARVHLIPVGSVLAGLVSEGPLSDLRPTDLYSDGDPHGTATTYFLAAMITYASLYGAPPPPEFRDWDKVDPLVADRYAEAAAYVWEAVQPFLPSREQAAAQALPAPAPVQTPVQAPVQEDAPARAPLQKPVEGAVRDAAAAGTAAPSRPDDIATAAPVAPAPLPSPDASDAIGLTNPSLAMGLNGIADFSTQHPFIDIMKTARPWVGHLPDAWGAITEADLRAGGHLDRWGWPLSLPPRATQIETFVLTEQPPEARSLAGRYRVTWQGRGDLSIGGVGRPERMTADANTLWFTFTPDAEGLVALIVRAVDPDDPIRNIEIVREDHIALHEAGAIYNPDFVERIADLRSLRFMDWTFTNSSEKATWNDRARIENYTFVGPGVPVEYIVHLSNLVGADPWVNMPHLADDDFMRRYAETMRDGLDPRLRIYVEYSNEVWNFIFTQAVHARDSAAERWGRRAGDDAWMQWAGMRAAQMADIWAGVFAGQRERLVPTIGVHSGWLGLEEPLLEAPLWVAEGEIRPADRFAAYAVTGYFGFELGDEEHAPTLVSWLEEAAAEAEAEGRAQGLQRVALREFVRASGTEHLFPRLTALLRESSLPELTETLWPYHAAKAADYGMRMVMYEGGTHVAPHGAFSGNEALSAFMQAYNYSDEMAAIYHELLARWRDSGGTLYNAFVDIAPPSQFGSWGALRHIDDATARWEALMAFNANQPAWWEARRADAFVHGVTLIGGNGADLLQGTTEEDILIGGPGDDAFLALGRSDILHGGPGVDVAVLPGALGDYTFAREGGRLVAIRGRDRVRLTQIERLQFDDQAIDTAGL